MADLAAIQAYQAAARTASGAAEGVAQTNDTQGPDFTNMVAQAIADTQAGLANAEQLSVAGATGDAELVDVVTAISAAEVQLEAVVAVRDEVIRAYKEILQMPI